MGIEDGGLGLPKTEVPEKEKGQREVSSDVERKRELGKYLWRKFNCVIFTNSIGSVDGKLHVEGVFVGEKEGRLFANLNDVNGTERNEIINPYISEVDSGKGFSFEDFCWVE